MATRRIKDITNTATTFASDDFIALDGATQGTRKMDKDDLIAEVSAGVSGDYLEEANNLSDVASLDTSKLNMEIPDVGTAPNEVPLNGQLGSMAYQSSEGISVARAEVESTTGTATTQALTVTDGTDTKFVVQEDGRAGLGTSSPGSYDGNADDLVVQTGGHTGITVRSSSTTTGNINFADGTSGNERYRGIVSYSHNTDALSLGTAGATRCTIDSTGRVGIGTSSPGGKLTVETGSSSGLQLYRSALNANFDAIQFQNTTNTGTNGKIGFASNELRLEGTSKIGFNTSGTEQWAINSTGNLVASSGLGIDFGSGSTGSGTVTGGLLDDYEFGDFTVTAGGTWTVTPTSMGGRYVKVGNLVTCWVTFGGSPSKTSATSGWLEGLPFATNVYPGQGSVSDTSVVDRGNCYAANVNRLWLTGTSFGVNSYATVTYRHD